jgi:hypothetical protein
MGYFLCDFSSSYITHFGFVTTFLNVIEGLASVSKYWSTRWIFFVWENVVLNLKDLLFYKVFEEKIHHVGPPSPLLVQIIGLLIFYVFIIIFQFVAHNLESKLDCCGKQ